MADKRVKKHEWDFPKTNLQKAIACVDKEVSGWNRTQLTDLEKWSYERLIIWGIVDLALYILTPKDYQALKQYIYDEYGYNVGGAIEKDEKGATNDSRRTNQRKQ